MEGRSRQPRDLCRYLPKPGANSIDYQAFFKNELDAFPTIDNDGFALLFSCVGQKLNGLRRSVFLSDGVRSNYLDGDLELSFANCATFNCTAGHAGVRIFPRALISDAEEQDGMKWVVETVNQLDSVVNDECLDIGILLEPAELYGNRFLTSGILFRFSSCCIGYEEFEHMQQKVRSNILIDPDWTGYKLIHLHEIVGI